MEKLLFISCDADQCLLYSDRRQSLLVIVQKFTPTQGVCFFWQEIFYLAQGKISSQGSFINDSFGVGTAKITRFYHVRVCSLMSAVFTDEEAFTDVFTNFNYNKEMKNDSWVLFRRN